MQAALQKIHDPAKAKAYFEDKLSFTTGPIELERMMKSHESAFTIVDVREAEDFAKGHIPGAINVPKDHWGHLDALDKEKTSIVYCYSGVCHLGASACVVFATHGYPVMELDGGFAAWKEYDLDVEKAGANRLAKASSC